MNKEQISEVMSMLGKRGVKARVKKAGGKKAFKEKMRQIAVKRWEKKSVDNSVDTSG